MTAGILSLSLEPRGTCSGAGKGAMRRPILPNSSALSVVNSVAIFLNSFCFLLISLAPLTVPLPVSIAASFTKRTEK